MGKDGNAITLVKAEPDQRVGCSACALVPLPECHGTGEVAAAGPVRLEAGLGREHLANI